MKEGDIDTEIEYGDIAITYNNIIGPYPQYNIGVGPNFNVGAIGTNGSYNYTTNSTGGSWSNISSTPGLTCSGDANFEGDVKIKGVSIAKALDDINKRLAILVPDPAKLEHFEALKKAYDHYKLLEALCELPTEPKE